MISAFLKRLRDEEIILQIGLAWYSQNITPAQIFLPLVRLRKRAMCAMAHSGLMLCVSLCA
jgi:hypothetical protein